ncbi:MAG TPA: LysM peptidoglycan-binding domain-containing protein [Chlamydiales bacterium]|nr:LysM peptidoglycan-binding domain-containing protein [Chlamydiales bacterium]
MKKLIFLFSLIALSSCSPIKTSPKEEKYQLELTLHEVQTNLDDLRHDLNSFKTEIQIVDARIRHQELAMNDLKQEHTNQLVHKLESLSKQVQTLEQARTIDRTQLSHIIEDLKSVTNKINETTVAIVQHKKKLNLFEKYLSKQDESLKEVAFLKGTLKDLLTQLKQEVEFEQYTVQMGDSLDKISRKYNVSIEKIKEINALDNDLIVIGQKLKLPISR